MKNFNKTNVSICLDIAILTASVALLTLGILLYVFAFPSPIVAVGLSCSCIITGLILPHAGIKNSVMAAIKNNAVSHKESTEVQENQKNHKKELASGLKDTKITKSEDHKEADANKQNYQCVPTNLVDASTQVEIALRIELKIV